MTNKKKVIILISAGILFFFGGTLLLSSLKREEKIGLPLPTPTPITSQPTPTSVINAPTPPKQQIYKDILLPLLPYGTEEFEIEYLKSSETFVITIRESPYDENRKKAEDWFRQKGVENLNDLKILYSKYRWVY